MAGSLGGFFFVDIDMGVEPTIGGFPPKWMVKITETPIKIDDLGVPQFLETPIYIYLSTYLFIYIYIDVYIFCIHILSCRTVFFFLGGGMGIPTKYQQALKVGVFFQGEVSR